MKLKRSLAATLCAAGLMGISAGAEAAPVLFDFQPCGNSTCTITGAAVLDQAPGNDLGIGGVVPGGVLPVGTTVQDLFQANLNSVLGATSNNLFSNGTGGNFFTFVAGFGETVSSSGVLGTTVVNNFSVDPGGFFKMCVQSAGGNDLAGTGFACADDGILSGHALGGNATQAGFLALLAPLDGSPNGDQRPGITTVQSSGAANLILQIDTVNNAYFPDLLAGGLITIGFTNTSNITPFNQVDPSLLFSSNGVANGDTPDNIGAINGITGPNFQFQADANTSFARTIPEPGTLALLGLAVAGMGRFLRRRGKKVG